MTYPVKSPKKLIEVALPLDAINAASVREGYIYRGNPSSLHKWWAQRPLTAARAVIFAQLVNDPSWNWDLEHPGEVPSSNLKASWAARRKRLFKIIEELVKWENTNDEAVLERARAEIRRSWREVCDLNKDHPQAAILFDPDKLPPLHDPFAGGGTIPLEAQRLGLEAYASDLNPVAVLINKAMIEIPPKFAGQPPVHPPETKDEAPKVQAFAGMERTWKGTEGLAEDVSYYGAWMRKEAQKRIGHLYPQIEITAEIARERPDLKPLVGQKLTVIAWLWARTVKSPQPAFSHVDVPLATTFILSTREGKEAYVQPVVEGDHYYFTVKVGVPPPGATNGTKLARGANFRCLMSDTAMEANYIKSEGCAGRMGARLMAIVAEGARGRVYLSPSEAMEATARQANPEWRPDILISGTTQYLGVKPYGMEQFSQLFTNRQIVALTAFSDLVQEARDRVMLDAIHAGMPNDGEGLAVGGTGATSYSESVAVYLAFIVSKTTDYNCALVPWYTKEDRPGHLFSKQAIPMVWDYTELNPLSEIGGGLATSSDIVGDALAGCPEKAIPGKAVQFDAVNLRTNSISLISTDPPYYDNVPYADLSDFFYVWLRRSLRVVFPDLFATITTPKAEELVAFAYRHANKGGAEEFFLEGMTQAMQRLTEQTHPAFPVTIYYAFKQSESDDIDGTVSTGWATFLNAVIRAGFAITGTWPMRTERSTRSRGIGSNALASCIVLVCRKRSGDAPTVSRREFLRELNAVLPEALDEMTKGSGDDRSPVAPVDLSQAIIGPGMAIFSKYAAVLEADGSPMSVRTALQLINRFLAEDDFDADTQFCLHWFEENGWKEGIYGQADVLARAKGTSVDGVRAAGVVESGGGSVRLRKWAEYPAIWEPSTDNRTPVWEVLHHLIRILKQGSEADAGRMLNAVAGKGEATRQLAYRLYTLCERQGWAEDARAYNELITSWTGIESAAGRLSTQPVQGSLFE